MTTDVERRPDRTGWGPRIAVPVVVAALLGVAVLVIVRPGSGDSPGAHKTPTTTTGRNLVPVTADLVRRDGGFAETAAGELEIEGYNGSALLSFSAAEVDTACVQQAELAVTQLSGTGSVDVWVSLETDAATYLDGTQLGTSVIAQGSPSVSAASAAAGDQIRWDVTPLLRWQQELQPDAGAVVLVLKPGPNQGNRPSFAALESGDMARLYLTRSPACG